MARIFVYDQREFPDPDPKLSVDEVRQSMSSFFPELSNAETKQSKRGEDDIIEFHRRVGTKGATPQVVISWERFEEALEAAGILKKGESVSGIAQDRRALTLYLGEREEVEVGAIRFPPGADPRD